MRVDLHYKKFSPEQHYFQRRMDFKTTRRPCDAPNCKLFSRKQKQEKEQQMKNYEVEFRIASLQLEAQNHALLKEIRNTESAALRHALKEILGIFKHWTFGGSPINTNNPLAQ
jgi:hypothetical protein